MCKYHKFNLSPFQGLMGFFYIIVVPAIRCCLTIAVQLDLVFKFIFQGLLAAKPIPLTCSSSLSHTSSYFNPIIVCVCAAGNIVKSQQSRKRLIIQQPSNGGQDCPEVLEEEQDCELPKVCPGFR